LIRQLQKNKAEADCERLRVANSDSSVKVFPSSSIDRRSLDPPKKARNPQPASSEYFFNHFIQKKNSSAQSMHSRPVSARSPKSKTLISPLQLRIFKGENVGCLSGVNYRMGSVELFHCATAFEEQ
jgi:hypothetical protein